MDSSEIFKKRAGTTDRGKEYENIAIANIVLQMVSDEKIDNFHISSNDNNFGAFDDVVIKIESHQNVVVKAMQLKHSDRKTLSSEHLKSAKGEFSLGKYFDSFQQLKNVEQEFIIFTNRSFGVKEDAKFQLQGQKFYVRPVRVCSSPDHFAISKNVNYIYKFEIVEDAWTTEHISEIQEYQTFFSKLFLYTNQESFDTLRQSTIEKFRTTYSLKDKDFDQFYKIISEWNMREGYKEKLNKRWMKRAIALQILSPHIEPLCFGVVNDKMKILRDAISMFTITLVEENSSENAKILWGDVAKQNIDIAEINRIRINYQLSVDDINANDVEKLNSKLFSQLLWLMDKCPLIIREFKNFEKAVKLCEDLKFVVLGDGMKEQWMTHYSLFQNLSNLSLKEQFYQKVMETFTVSIQGKEEFSLMAGFGKTEKFLENVTTSDLMGMLNGPCFIDGEKEILSEPYIERHLSQNVLDINYLEKVHENTVIILQYADNFDKVEDKLRNYQLINVDVSPNEQSENDEGINVVCNESEFKDSFIKSDLRNKMYICNSKVCESKLEQIYTDNSKMHRFHYFKVANNGHLQWIQSKGDMSDLENYKLSNSSFTHENLLSSSQLENNINLITSDPGMGKSELMKSFKNKCPSQNWTVTIYPKDVHLFFKSFKLSQGSNYLTWFERFIINEKYCSLKTLHQSFFEMCLKQNRIVYVWDGLDEILNEYLDVVSDIILQLSKRGFVQWVTSRKHLQTFLEKKFNVLSIGLTQFSDKEQQNYIKQRLKFVRSEAEIEITVQKIKSTFVIIEHVDILGIPLQIFMLTELFRRNNEKYVELIDNKFRLTNLYRNFIEEKFNIFYENKSAYDLQNPHMAVMVRREKEKMLKHFEILALKLIYPEFVLERLNINYQKSVKKFSRYDYASVGIITEVQNNAPHFLHGSFAEYLVATYLSKNFADIPIDIFFDQKYNNVRFFFDMLLAEETPVHVAVLHKNFNLLRSCDDEILTCKDRGGRSALHLICSWGKRHPRLHITHENNKYTVREETNFNGKPESTEFLEAVMYLQSKNSDSEHDSLLGITPLLYAKKSESLAAEIKLLLTVQKNSNIFQSYSSKDKINILYYSALLEYDDVAKLLSYEKLGISRAEINSITEANHCTPLVLASSGGHKQIVDYLVKSGAEINRSDKEGFTPLYLAAQNGHEEIVKYLVKFGAEIDRCANSGRTPLYAACQNGHQKIVEYLVESGVEINRPDNEGFTPLYLASQNGYEEVVKYLVKFGADINRCSNDSRTPVYAACQYGHRNIVEYLHLSGADINRSGVHDFTPLRVASYGGHQKTVEYLVKSGVELNRANNDGFTPLYLASYNGHEETVKYLVKSGAEVNRCTNVGRTPLYRACLSGHKNIVQYLHLSGADINCSDVEGFTPLYSASQNGHEEIVKYLVNFGAEINRCSNDGRTPVYAACQDGHRNIVEYLVESGVEINYSDGEGCTALYLACHNGDEETVKYLVKSGAEVNRCTNDGRTPLNAACGSGHKNIVQYLHLSGADISCANVDGHTPLRSASCNGHQKTVEYLVESGVEINRADNEGFTPLYLASQNGHEETVKYLVKSGAEINRSAKNGRTPLYAASRYGHKNIVEDLVESGVEINCSDGEGYTALYLACHNGDEETVKYLVKSGAEVNRCTNDGRTPLYAACPSGHKNIVEYLHLSGADINCVDVNGFTLLRLASFDGHQKIVEYLVESGVEINRADNEGFTPLYVASQNGHEETAKYLVKFGAEINRCSNDGRTPVYAACQYGHRNIVEYLHLSGADINRAEVHHFTPLRVASCGGHQKIVEYLVESGVELNRANNEGFSPLYLASQNGHEETVKYLVKSGAEVNRCRNDGRTPLHAACRFGHKNIVQYLHLSGADVNCADVDGYTPLRVASSYGHRKIVEYLVESGVEKNRADNES
ncbi:uncharacterized protein LOC135139554 [Zophobas morio]|uniref:uncharacterized protein LOC135139554 n=1 Tax=Zophobas morio TaxID=2755281 RepID=UPI003082B63A